MNGLAIRGRNRARCFSKRLRRIAVPAGALGMALGWLLAATPWATAKPKDSKLVGNGPTTFRDLPRQPAMLVALRVSTGLLNPSVLMVRSIQPKYLTPAGKVNGKAYGRGASAKVQSEFLAEFLDLEAKEGYAVGAIVVKAGDRVDGFRVVFMRIKGDRLDPNDKYESRWVGGRGGRAETLLGGDGKPVIGIHGRCGDDLDSIGLIQDDAPAQP